MKNPFKSIWNILKRIVTRAGLDRFIFDHWDEAVDIVEDLARLYPDVPFHQWKDEAWRRIAIATGCEKGNWITALLTFAYEAFIAKKR